MYTEVVKRSYLLCLSLFACQGAEPSMVTSINLSEALDQGGYTFKDFTVDGVCIPKDDPCLKDGPFACVDKPSSFSVNGTLDTKDTAIASVPACGQALVALTLHRKFEDNDLVSGLSGLAFRQLAFPSDEFDMHMSRVGQLAVSNPGTTPLDCGGEEGSVEVSDVTIPAGGKVKIPLQTKDFQIHCKNPQGTVTKYSARVAFAERTQLDLVRPIAAMNVTLPQSTGSGEATTVTISFADASGQAVENVTGTLLFSTNDTLAVLPASYELKTADKGTVTLPVTFHTVGQGINLHVELTTFVTSVNVPINVF